MRTFVVGINGATPALKALHWMGRWVAPDDRVCLVHATGCGPSLSQDLRDRMFTQVLAPLGVEHLEVAELVLRQTPSVDVRWEIRSGEAADVLLQVAEEMTADAIVIGHHADGWADRLMSGKLAKALIARGTCAVIVAR